MCVCVCVCDNGGDSMSVAVGESRFLLLCPPTPLSPRADEPGRSRHQGASVDKSFRSGRGCLAWGRASSCPAKKKSVPCYRASKSKSVDCVLEDHEVVKARIPISQMGGRGVGTL